MNIKKLDCFHDIKYLQFSSGIQIKTLFFNLVHISSLLRQYYEIAMFEIRVMFNGIVTYIRVFEFHHL